MDDNNLPKGLFGLSKKDVEAYVSGIKNSYEKEIMEQTKQLQEMKIENAKLNEKINTLMNEKKDVEASKANISDVLIRAEEQAKQIIEDARKEQEKERQQIDALIEEQKEKLIDAKIELAMLKDKAKEVIDKFTEDISKLQ
jgi:cell division septum initiation protein DivIVA